MEETWTIKALKEHIERIFSEKEKANDQRFRAQEEAITTAEHNRDTAIKKAEDSIEKKSDAVYVKLSDLAKAMTEVMMRPEIESRLTSLAEKVDDLKSMGDKGEGRGAGQHSIWLIFVALIGVIGGVVTILSKINK